MIFNRTGIVIRNPNPNTTITENEITNNWTVGILWLDGTTADATSTTFFNNKIEGNWYTQIENRSTNGGVKNFTGNWLGSINLTTANTNGTEPGYSSLIPLNMVAQPHLQAVQSLSVGSVLMIWITPHGSPLA